MENIKTAFNRSVEALKLKPNLGIANARSVTTMVDGLTCKSEEGEWSFITDMPKNAGGNGKGPTAGVLGRAALGSCLTIGYLMYAAHREIDISKLSVIVDVEFDNGALFGTSDAYPGYTHIEYTVEIESSADEATIEKLLEEAEVHSPYLDVFSRAQKCHRKLIYKSSKK